MILFNFAVDFNLKQIHFFRFYPMRTWLIRCFLIGLIGFCPPLSAQNQRPWEQQLADLHLVGDDDPESQTNIIERLTDLEQNRISSVSAERETWEQLPFLTPHQVEDICAYIYRHGAIRTEGEWRMIASLDAPTIELLSHFVTLEQPVPSPLPSVKNLLTYGHHDAMFTFHLPLYRREGDRRGYLGYPYRHDLRYTFNYGNMVKAAFIGAQDAGEPFFAGNNSWGYDHYAGYLQLTTRSRRQQITIGHYRINIGQGLVINTQFRPGKGGFTASSATRQPDIKGHASRSSYDYLQGAAVRLRMGRQWMVTAFASYRSIDALRNKEDNAILSIQSSGYHRTVREMARKNNNSEWLMGANMAFETGGFHMGITAVGNGFNMALQPDKSVVRKRYDPEGSHFFNVSADYAYAHGNWLLCGETAIDTHGHPATANRLDFQPSSRFRFMVQQRYFSYQYHALHANAMSEGGMTRNESGIMTGAKWMPTEKVALTVYADMAYHAWQRYQASRSSTAQDFMAELTYRLPKGAITFYQRLQIREKDNDDKTALVKHRRHRSRVTADFSELCWQWRTRAELSFVNRPKHAKGLMLSQEVTYRPSKRWFVKGVGAYFDIEDYEARIYFYEKSVSKSFGFSSYQGHGIRTSVLMGLHLGQHWELTTHIGATHYFDRSSISTALQRIDSSTKTDVVLQLRMKW